MIAPIRQPFDPLPEQPDQLTVTRQALAAKLLAQSAPTPQEHPNTSERATWAMVAWVVGVTIGYFAFRSWWSMRID